jgi:polysaccharide export outer membrane protein
MMISQTSSRMASLLLAGVIVTASAAAQTPPAGTATTKRTTTTGPITTPVVPADYVIGPEDVLGVVFWREADISGDVTVRPDGVITLPLIGEMKASGMKSDALRDAIQTAAGKYLTEPNVSVIVRQLNSRKVFITGQVATSGAHALTGPRTVMQLIALAGGLAEYAKSDEISIMRTENGRTRSFKFNYKEVSRGKKLEQNIQLQPGDTVVVP